ncbi:NADPH-dependent ferric siderophore reductase, contains FAD-binding and SIP domains [Ruegeria halocynthiae]|uniref:NADPH-dependent ferric siderophore reductase, contains FAD-binding and SIP domains n=1 Tax=Ruegeria halocynthiae TaxID=985054 RepID=A0A1H2XYS5_9RHOB|nr:siderophore-interacting protein [Ruegeria halocynthiae]SDW97728.1 NADPH-dependent ferric siderophore reductase, contains FAD-binding and SIP domains [Ruegeria halocynthiae]
MTVLSSFPLQSETILPGIDFSALKQVILHEAQEHDLAIIENTETRVITETPFGSYCFQTAPEGVLARIYATKPDWLFMLQESFVEHLAHFLPHIVEGVRWSDGPKTGALPPNFHFATVISVKPVGTCFLRVRIKARNLSSFQDDAIHFRLVLPPAGLEDIEWPSVSENGSTIWPKGEKALHRPVYTTRWIDHSQGLMDFDVFLHEGGRTTGWATGAQPGDLVAVVGPGGGGLPNTKRILIYADETALPAAARILESLPHDAQGHVAIQAAQGALCAYSLSAPEGVSITWMKSENTQSLSQLADSAHQEFPDHFMWFACEKVEVQKLRAAFKNNDGDPANAYIAAYWSA